jgi:polyisoprenoid-binding protein YceI
MRSLLFLFVLLTTSLFAQDQVLVVNSQHSSIIFEVPFMQISKVQGSLPRFDGSFKFNPVNKKISELSIKMSVGQLTTSDSRRDRHLKSSDFFNAQVFPYVRFDMTGAHYQSDVLNSMEGKLTIKDITRDIKISAKYLGEVEDENKFKTYFFEVKGSLKRSDYGLSWNKQFSAGSYIVGDEIQFSGKIESHPINKVPQFSRFFARSESDLAASKLKIERGETLSAGSENALLHSDIQKYLRKIDNLENDKEFLERTLAQTKFKEQELREELQTLKAQRYFSVWEQLVLIVVGGMLFALIAWKIIRKKLSLEQDQSADPRRKVMTNALLDGIYTVGIFSLCYFVYIFVLGKN